MASAYFKFAVLLVAGVAILPTSTAEAQVCGTAQPDAAKTCISVRLPWQAEPIYFCTEKEKLPYERSCEKEGMQPSFCGNHWENSTLLIATPWECCPLVSVPTRDPCKSAECPPAPFNRTCTNVTAKVYPSDCCPKYFCEDGAIDGETTNCNFKFLEPSCHKAPKDKKGCVGFLDPFGCCNKFQCEDEGKPGVCPAQAHYNKQNKYHYHHAHHHNHTAKGMKVMAPGTYRAARGPYPDHDMGHGVGHGHEGYPSHHYGHGDGGSCIGDYNCPGEMKCCGGTMVYHAYAGMYAKERPEVADMIVRHAMTYAVHGFCVEPAKEAENNHSSYKVTTVETPTEASASSAEQ